MFYESKLSTYQKIGVDSANKESPRITLQYTFANM